MVAKKILIIGAVVVVAATALILGLVFGLQNNDKDEDSGSDDPENLELEPPWNLRFINAGDQLNVTWMDDNVLDLKLYTVTIIYSYNRNLKSTHTTTNPSYYLKKPVVCTTVEVTIVTEGYKGSSGWLTSSGKSISFTESRDPIVVSNFKVSDVGGTLKTEWEYPRFPLEFCKIEDIEYEVNIGIQYWHTRGYELLLENNRYYKPCDVVDVSVVPIFDGTRPTSRVIEPYKIGLLDNFGGGFQYNASVVSAESGYFLYLEWELDDIGVCAVEYVVSCSDGGNPAIEEQINLSTYVFKSCSITDESGHDINVVIQPRLPGSSGEADKDGQTRTCSFVVYYESDSWKLSGDCGVVNQKPRFPDNNLKSAHHSATNNIN